MDKPGKVLLVNLGGLGDIVMMEPVLRALKERLPDARATLLTIPRSEAVARNLKGLDVIRTIPLRFRAPSLLDYPKLIFTLLDLRKQRFDVLVNLKAVETTGGSLRMRLLALFIGARFAIGRSFEGKGAFFDANFTEKQVEPLNEVQLTARLFAPLGIERIDTTLKFPVRDTDRKMINDHFSHAMVDGGPLVGINPGAFRPTHRWPIGQWKTLIRLLEARHPKAWFFVTGGADEKYFAEQLRVIDRITVTNGELTINTLAALLERLDVYITSDSGPMHLAGAVGTRIAAIFGPGNEIRYAPSIPKERYKIIRLASVPCERPCYSYDCDTYACMTGILPETVANAACELLGDIP